MLSVGGSSRHDAVRPKQCVSGSGSADSNARRFAAELRWTSADVASRVFRQGGQTPPSVFIVAENIAVVLEEVRARMAPTCVRAKVTKLDLDSETIIVL